MPDVQVVHLGRIAYGDALALQRAAAAARLAGTIPDVLLLCEHPPVVTLGRSTKTANLTATPAALAARGVEVHEVERGGDVTFHGPGQLVGYPILDLGGYRKDLHWYLRQLEATLITALGRYEIVAEQRPGLTGVWTGDRKIASIGVHARGWVTWHGFALNVTTDLSYFDLMVPCGIADVEMTSIARERPDATVETVDDTVVVAFAETFGVAVMSSTPEFLFSLQG
jgi:lipoate-protein ligase B